MFEKLKSIVQREKRKPQAEEKPVEQKEKKLPKSVGFVVYRCRICGYQTGSRKNIRRHVRETHRREYTARKQALKWETVTDELGNKHVVYNPSYAESPRKNRFHLSEMYERVLIRG